MAYSDTTAYWPGVTEITSPKMAQMSDNDEALCIQIGGGFDGERANVSGETGTDYQFVFESCYFLPVTADYLFDTMRVYLDQDAAVENILGGDNTFQHCFSFRAIGPNAATVFERAWTLEITGAENVYTLGPDGNWKSPELALSSFYGYTFYYTWRLAWSGAAELDCKAYGRPLLYHSSFGEPDSGTTYTEINAWIATCPAIPS